MIFKKSIVRCMFLHGSRVAHKVPTRYTKKLFTRISNSFSTEIIFMWTSGFYRYEHLLHRADMNYLQKQKFQNILERNYAIVLGSCYMLLKKMLNMKLNMMLIVLVEFAYIIDISEIYSRFNDECLTI